MYLQKILFKIVLDNIIIPSLHFIYFRIIHQFILNRYYYVISPCHELLNSWGGVFLHFKRIGSRGNFHLRF